MRLPPHAPEEEKAVIGCLVSSPELACVQACARLHAEAFYDIRNRELFSVIVRMQAEGEYVDLLSVSRTLKQNPESVWKSGVIEYLSEAAGLIPSASALGHYVEIIREKWTLRRLIERCGAAISRAMDNPEDVAELVSQAERDILTVRLSDEKKEVGIKELALGAVATIEAWHANGGKISGIETGFPDLDRMTDGLKPGEMTVMGGYPGSGKTTLACQMALHAAVRAGGISVAVFSLEMSAQSLVTRLLCCDARIDSHAVRRGNFTEGDASRLMRSLSDVSKATMHFPPMSDLSVSQFRSSARDFWQRGVRLIVVDYLQLLKPDPGTRHESRQVDVRKISNEIKAATKELNIPIIALSQLNKDGECGESSALGQDGDNVWIIKPDEKGGQNVSLEIRKQRNGPTGSVSLVFLKQFTRFESATKIDPTDYADR